MPSDEAAKILIVNEQVRPPRRLSNPLRVDTRKNIVGSQISHGPSQGSDGCTWGLDSPMSCLRNGFDSSDLEGVKNPDLERFQQAMMVGNSIRTILCDEKELSSPMTLRGFSGLMGLKFGKDGDLGQSMHSELESYDGGSTFGRNYGRGINLTKTRNMVWGSPGSPGFVLNTEEDEHRQRTPNQYQEPMSAGTTSCKTNKYDTPVHRGSAGNLSPHDYLSISGSNVRDFSLDLIRQKTDEQTSSSEQEISKSDHKALKVQTGFRSRIASDCYCEIFTMDTFGYLRQILIPSSSLDSCSSPLWMPAGKSPYMTPPSSGCKNESGPPIEWGKLFEGITETMAISPNKNDIFIGGRNGIMKQYDINKRGLKRDWKQIHKGAIYSIQITSDSQNVITCGKDSYIRYWHIPKGLLVNEMRTSLTSVITKSSVLCKDDTHLFTGGSDCLLKKWTIHKSDHSPCEKNNRMPNWECVEYPAVHRNPITMVKLAPDGQHVLSISDDEFLVKWKVGACSEEDCFFKIGSVSKDGITNMEISADGKWVLVTGFDNRLKQIDMEYGLVVKDYGVIHGDQITQIILTEGKHFYPLTYRLELPLQLWGRWIDEAMGYCRNAVENRLWAYLVNPCDWNLHPELRLSSIKNFNRNCDMRIITYNKLFSEKVLGRKILIFRVFALFEIYFLSILIVPLIRNDFI